MLRDFYAGKRPHLPVGYMVGSSNCKAGPRPRAGAVIYVALRAAQEQLRRASFVQAKVYARHALLKRRITLTEAVAKAYIYVPCTWHMHGFTPNVRGSKDFYAAAVCRRADGSA